MKEKLFKVTSIKMNMISRSNKCKNYNCIYFTSINNEEDEAVIETHVFFVNSFRNKDYWTKLKVGDVVTDLHFVSDRQIVNADYAPFVLTKEQVNLILANTAVIEIAHEKKNGAKLDW